MRQKKSGIQIEEHQQHFSYSKNPPNYNEQQKANFYNKQPELMNKKTLICCSSSQALIATKSIIFKLLKVSHVKLFLIKTKPPSRVLILLFIPSVYFYHFYHKSSYLYILFLITLCVFVLSLLNLASKLKLFNTQKTRTPVVWSIGSKNNLPKSTVSGLFVKVYSNGDVYEGEFYKGKCSGSGVYYYNMNGRYEGDWVDQKYDGFGVETWAKGSRYRGQYRQGLRHGFGVYRFYVGDMYSGEWVKGQSHGFGVHSCEDGSKFFGEFKGGVKHGIGHYHFRNGDMYAGEYFSDKMHGFGVYNFANGHKYEGGWHEGRRQGFGMYTFRNGDTQSGHWDDGVLSISTTQHTISPISNSHAKVLKAVQESRRIAEKAVGAANVEEKVNRAVAAANRAANAARVAAVKAVQSHGYHHYDTDDPTLVIV